MATVAGYGAPLLLLYADISPNTMFYTACSLGKPQPQQPTRTTDGCASLLHQGVSTRPLPATPPRPHTAHRPHQNLVVDFYDSTGVVSAPRAPHSRRSHPPRPSVRPSFPPPKHSGSRTTPTSTRPSSTPSSPARSATSSRAAARATRGARGALRPRVRCARLTAAT